MILQEDGIELGKNKFITPRVDNYMFIRRIQEGYTYDAI